MTDYEGLKKAVADYLGWDAGGEIEEYLPEIIRMAEVRMQRDARLRVMERTGWRNTIPGETDVWLPDKRIPGDWDAYLSMREVCLQGQPNVNIAYASPDVFTDYSSFKGRPTVYTVTGRSLRLAPVPDKEYKILLTYYAEIPPLGEEQPTNEVLLSYPDLYLYACLTESVPLLRSSVPLENWLAMYREALGKANESDSEARFAGQLSIRAPRSNWRIRL